MIPVDLYQTIVHFFPIRDLLDLRLVSREVKEATRCYDRKVVVNMLTFYSYEFLKYFPKAKQVFYPLEVNDSTLDDFVCIRQMGLWSQPSEQMFRKTPRLEKLQVNRIETTINYSQLTQLRCLSVYGALITDEDLSLLKNLTELTLSDCLRVSTVQGLPKLKKLSLFRMLILDDGIVGDIEDLSLTQCPNITKIRLGKLKKLYLANQALIGDGMETECLEDLEIHTPCKITDQGICKLSRLRTLVIHQNKQYDLIHGDGFRKLRDLKKVSFTQCIIHDLSEVSQVEELILFSCTVQNISKSICACKDCNIMCEWKLNSLHLLNTTGCEAFEHYVAKDLSITICPGLTNR
jgi:hypothetical protein